MRCPNVNGVINGRDSLGQQFRYLCLLRQSIGERERGPVEKRCKLESIQQLSSFAGFINGFPPKPTKRVTLLHLGNSTAAFILASYQSSQCKLLSAVVELPPLTSTKRPPFNHEMNGINYVPMLPRYTNDSERVKV